MEMPPALTHLLNHMLNTHGTIKSWNMYQGDSGFVNINIRFPNITKDSTVPVCSHVQPVSYKQVSSRQLSRNKDRAKAYKAKQQQTNVNTQTDHGSMKADKHTTTNITLQMTTVHTQTDNTMDNTNNKKRKFSPEKSRLDNSNYDNIELIDTPVSVKPETHEEEYQVHNFEDDEYESAVSREYDIVVSDEYNSTDADVKEYDSAASKEESVECVRDLSGLSTKADEYEIPPDEFSLSLPSVPPKKDNWFLKEKRLQLEQLREAEVAKYHALHKRLHHK